VTKVESHRFRQIAAIPEALFEQYAAAGEELGTASVAPLCSSSCPDPDMSDPEARSPNAPKA
jgi:hypothetical protein